MNKKITHYYFFLLLVSFLISGCDRGSGTIVSITGDKWYFNRKILNEGSPAEGLLMNVRMVNSVFSERGDRMPEQFAGFDPGANTSEFISKIPEYVAAGVNCFTISLQGGAPGYEGAVNTAFGADGTLRMEYMDRVERVIRAADGNMAAIILSCFYQRQHSHSSALDGRPAIENALANTVRWIKENGFRNVILEVSNEYRHGGFRNWKDGGWIISTGGQVHLMKLAKSINPALIVGTSGMGDGSLKDSLGMVADYITIHFNNTSLEDYQSKIEAMKKAGKPVICNEDDKLGMAGASALVLSVASGCGWGYMNSRKNQTMPFSFEGVKDDTVVYNMMKRVTTPGFKINEDELKQQSVIITSPNDGDIFEKGRRITVRFSNLFPDNQVKSIITILDNNKVIDTADGRSQFQVQPAETGVHYFEIVVSDTMGNEILRSPRVDVIVK